MDVDIHKEIHYEGLAHAMVRLRSPTICPLQAGGPGKPACSSSPNLRPENQGSRRWQNPQTWLNPALPAPRLCSRGCALPKRHSHDRDGAGVSLLKGMTTAVRGAFLPLSVTGPESTHSPLSNHSCVAFSSLLGPPRCLFILTLSCCPGSTFTLHISLPRALAAPSPGGSGHILCAVSGRLPGAKCSCCPCTSDPFPCPRSPSQQDHPVRSHVHSCSPPTVG